MQEKGKKQTQDPRTQLAQLSKPVIAALKKQAGLFSVIYFINYLGFNKIDTLFLTGNNNADEKKIQDVLQQKDLMDYFEELIKKVYCKEEADDFFVEVDSIINAFFDPIKGTENWKKFWNQTKKQVKRENYQIPNINWYEKIIAGSFLFVVLSIWQRINKPNEEHIQVLNEIKTVFLNPTRDSFLAELKNKIITTIEDLINQKKIGRIPEVRDKLFFQLYPGNERFLMKIMFTYTDPFKKIIKESLPIQFEKKACTQDPNLPPTSPTKSNENSEPTEQIVQFSAEDLIPMNIGKSLHGFFLPDSSLLLNSPKVPDHSSLVLSNSPITEYYPKGKELGKPQTHQTKDSRSEKLAGLSKQVIAVLMTQAGSKSVINLISNLRDKPDYKGTRLFFIGNNNANEKKIENVLQQEDLMGYFNNLIHKVYICEKKADVFFEAVDSIIHTFFDPIKETSNWKIFWEQQKEKVKPEIGQTLMDRNEKIIAGSFLFYVLSIWKSINYKTFESNEKHKQVVNEINTVFLNPTKDSFLAGLAHKITTTIEGLINQKKIGRIPKVRDELFFQLYPGGNEALLRQIVFTYLEPLQKIVNESHLTQPLVSGDLKNCNGPGRSPIARPQFEKRARPGPNLLPTSPKNLNGNSEPTGQIVKVSVSRLTPMSIGNNHGFFLAANSPSSPRYLRYLKAEQTQCRPIHQMTPPN